VAFLARNGGVSAKQRETILVILYLLGRNIPAFYRVTLFAIRTHLPAMNVCVAIGAILSNIGKDRLYVTLNTEHFFVHAAQRIVRLIVIELRNGADRTPAHRCVAVFARNRQRPVRAPCGLVLLRVRDRMRGGRHRFRRIAVSTGEDQQGPENELKYGSRNFSPTPPLGTRSKRKTKISKIIVGPQNSSNCTIGQILASALDYEKIAGNL
jgi:hypothetical protein